MQTKKAMPYKVKSIEVQITKKIRYIGNYCSSDCDFIDDLYGGCERCELRKTKDDSGDNLNLNYDLIQNKFRRTDYCLNIEKENNGTQMLQTNA